MLDIPSNQLFYEEQVIWQDKQKLPPQHSFDLLDCTLLHFKESNTPILLYTVSCQVLLKNVQYKGTSNDW